jgi:hypothetical protein
VPSSVGRLLIILLADIKPFLDYLFRDVDLPVVKNPFLFPPDLCPAGCLSRALKYAIFVYLGVGLSIQPWRYLAITIDRDIKPGLLIKKFEPAEQRLHNEQAYHGNDVASR